MTTPPAIQNLPDWLETATRDLVPSAQARIRLEIEAHYADALQSHSAGGASGPAAQSAALADLGDASDAATRFSREHLTIKEARAVAKRISLARSTTGPVFYGSMVSLLCSILMSFILIVAWAFEPALHGRFLLFPAALLLFVIIYASLSIAGDILARRKPILATARRLFWLGNIKTLILYATSMISFTAILMMQERGAFLKIPFMDLLTVGVWMGIFGILLSAVALSIGMTMTNFRLGKKLASACDDDFPPTHPYVT